MLTDSQISLLTPVQKYQYSYNLLHEGNYRDGFRLFEYRWHPDVIKTLPQQYIKYSPAPIWTGQPLFGKSIVVQMEMGYGDCIQWYRYLPMLKSLGAAHVTVVQTKSLHNLLSQMYCVDCITNDEKSFAVQYSDYWIGSISLTHRAFTAPKYVQTLFSTDKNKTVGQEGYLDAEPLKLPGKIKIGINWEGARTHLYDIKNMDVNKLSPLRELFPEVTFYSLNPNSTGPFERLPSESWKADWSETAGYMKSMDMVITIDTGTAHLAGALAVPCAVLVPDDDKYLCWRWRNKNWYNSTKIFKQQDLPQIIELIRNLI